MAEWQAMEAAMRVRSRLSSSFRMGSSGIGSGLLDDLGQRALQLGAFQAHRGGFDGKCLRAKGFDLKAVVFKFLGDAGEDHHLLGLELDQQRHQQALALNALHVALAQDFLKKHPFVCNMLVDDPQAIVSRGQNERLAQLAEGFQRAQPVESAAACSASTRPRQRRGFRVTDVPLWLRLHSPAAGRRRREEGFGGFAPCLRGRSDGGGVAPWL